MPTAESQCPPMLSTYLTCTSHHGCSYPNEPLCSTGPQSCKREAFISALRPHHGNTARPDASRAMPCTYIYVTSCNHHPVLSVHTHNYGPYSKTLAGASSRPSPAPDITLDPRHINGGRKAVERTRVSGAPSSLLRSDNEGKLPNA